MQQVEKRLEGSHSGKVGSLAQPCASRSGRAARRCRRRNNKLAEQELAAQDSKELLLETPDSGPTDDSTTASEAEQESSSRCSTPSNVAPEQAPETAEAAEVEVVADEVPPQLADDKVIYALAKILKHMAQSSKPTAHKSSFQSARLPSVSLSSFAARIHRFFKCTDECFVLCLVYIDRIIKLNPHFPVSDLTCHRLLLVGSMVAAKFHDDEYASNEYFAKVGGIDVKELNALEGEFLKMLNWKLFVNATEYDWFLQSLQSIP